MNDKIYIDLYHADHNIADSEKIVNLKALARFIYAFKVLLKSSYKKEAVFRGEGIELNSVLPPNGKKADIALIVASADDSTVLYEQLESEIGTEKVFLLCFDQKNYEYLNPRFHTKVFPLFYTKKDGNAITFLDFFIDGSEPENLLFLKVFDLIDAIHESVSEIWPANSPKETIYLALTDEKLTEERNVLKRELKRLGYKVAPEPVGMNRDSYNHQLKEAIEKSKLSIHLIHPADIALNGASISTQQNELALNKFKSNGGTSRILWIAGPENDDEWNSVERLKEKTEELEGAEVLQNSIETLRGLLKYKLNGNGEPVISRLAGTSSHQFKVYFLFDKIDEQNAKKLIGKLQLDENDLLIPLFKGNFYQLRNHHIHCLKEADIVVVFVEKVNPIWLQMKFLEILKSPGMGRNKRWLNQIIFLNNPQQIDWLEQHNNLTVLENDVAALAKNIELGRKMLSDERSL